MSLQSELPHHLWIEEDNEETRGIILREDTKVLIDPNSQVDQISREESESVRCKERNNNSCIVGGKNGMSRGGRNFSPF